VNTAAQIGRLTHLAHGVLDGPIGKPIQRLLALRRRHVESRLGRFPHFPFGQLRFVQDADDRRDRRQQPHLARITNRRGACSISVLGRHRVARFAVQ